MVATLSYLVFFVKCRNETKNSLSKNGFKI